MKQTKIKRRKDTMEANIHIHIKNNESRKVLRDEEIAVERQVNDVIAAQIMLDEGI